MTEIASIVLGSAQQNADLILIGMRVCSPDFKSTKLQYNASMIDSYLALTFLVLAALHAELVNGATLERASNIRAGMASLYSSSTSMPNQTFTISFGTSFSANPTFVFGINQYKLGDQFYYQNFASYKYNISSTSGSVQVISISSTNVKLFSIGWMASTENSFTTAAHTISSGANISSGSGERYYLGYFTGNFSSMNVLSLPMLSGFYIAASTYFKVVLEAEAVSTVNYQLKIKTTSDCQLSRVDIYILFCQTDLLTSSKYYYTGGTNVILNTDPNPNSFQTTVDNYSLTQFLLALRGFQGYSILTNCQWGWTMLNISADIATLNVTKYQLQYIYFSFFQFGKQVQTPSSSSDGSPLGIIAGVIVGILVLAVGIFLFLKYYWKRRQYQTPANDNFKQLPSLSL